MSERFERAIAAIDAANTGDPNTVVARGVLRPKEQAHAELMTEWVQWLDPDATEEQLLAARAHHLRRWSVPRDSYPEGRKGYLRWRRDLQRKEADEVAGILIDAGYDTTSAARVQSIIRKEQLATDPAVQVHEDALCLVFLETQAEDFATEYGEQRTVDVLAKTAKKMSAQGIAAASALDLPSGVRALLERVVSEA
jgi:hypothetical protein